MRLRDINRWLRLLGLQVAIYVDVESLFEPRPIRPTTIHLRRYKNVRSAP